MFTFRGKRTRQCWETVIGIERNSDSSVYTTIRTKLLQMPFCQDAIDSFGEASGRVPRMAMYIFGVIKRVHDSSDKLRSLVPLSLVFRLLLVIRLSLFGPREYQEPKEPEPIVVFISAHIRTL